jgi:predicted phage terminase large subunit-like protein
VAGRSPLFRVPKPDVDTVLQEIKVRAEIKKSSVGRRFDPELGDSWEEAESRLATMRTDVGKYGEYVLGLTPADIHSLWNRVADDVITGKVRQNKVLFIAPPNSAKSTWNSIIRPAHYLGQHPDHSLLFFTSSDTMSNTFASAVKGILGDSEKHRTVFPDRDARPHVKRGWSGEGLYLRGTPVASKDPAYKAVGFGASVMGARAHGIILDDPLDQKNAESETEQRRAKSYYDATVTPRLQIDGGWMIAVMTRFHENDFASHLIRLAQESGDWLVIETPMIATEGKPDLLGRNPGDVLWPDHFTQKYIDAEKRRMTVSQFNLIHQGDPTGMGGDVFETEEWFQDLPLNFWSEIMPNCQVVQAWDLAFSEQKRACFSVGITAAVDSSLNMYLLHVVRKRYSIAELEDTMVNLADNTNPILVGIEYSSFHQNLTMGVARRILERRMMNIQLVRPDKDKTARARLPAARAQHGMVFVNKKAHWYHAFISECLGFPNTKYKDQVDAFSLLALLVQKMGENVRTGRPIQIRTTLSA